MSEDRTSPMRVPGKPGREPQNDQETISSDRDAGMAPTINVPGQGQGPGFVRSTPYETPTPPPQQRPPTPFGPPPSPGAPFGPGGFPPPATGGTADRTVVISSRTPPTFAWLVVVDSPDRSSVGSVHTLRPDMTTVGRAQGNTIVLPDQTCSSQHFRIRVEAKEGEEPEFVLFDMGSRNGTFVGPKATFKDESSRAYRHTLQDGDYLLVGETTLVFKKV